MQTSGKAPGLGTRVRLLPPTEPRSRLMLKPWPRRHCLATLGCLGNSLATGRQGQNCTPPPNALLLVFPDHPAPPRPGALGSCDPYPQSWPNCIGTPGLPGPGPSAPRPDRCTRLSSCCGPVTRPSVASGWLVLSPPQPTACPLLLRLQTARWPAGGTGRHFIPATGHSFCQKLSWFEQPQKGQAWHPDDRRPGHGRGIAHPGVSVGTEKF